MSEMRKILPAAAAVLAFGLLAGCSAAASSSAISGTPVTTAPATAPVPSSLPPSAVSSTPATTPIGTWSAVSTSDPADVYGQYSITESGGQYVLTTSTALKLAGGLPNGCSVPPGAQEATFSAVASDLPAAPIYSGTENSWYSNTCTFSNTVPATMEQLSADKMVMTGAITLIRISDTPVSVPTSSSAAPTAPAPATTTLATKPGPVLWCGQVAYGTRPATISPMSAWLAYERSQGTLALDGDRSNFTTTVDDIEAPGVTAADTYQLGTALCEEVGGAEAFPPPADLALFDKAVNDFYQASILIHARKSGALPYLEDGTDAFDAFLSAARA
jgi:hypothetical protein